MKPEKEMKIVLFRKLIKINKNTPTNKLGHFTRKVFNSPEYYPVP